MENVLEYLIANLKQELSALNVFQDIHFLLVNVWIIERGVHLSKEEFVRPAQLAMFSMGLAASNQLLFHINALYLTISMAAAFFVLLGMKFSRSFAKGLTESR